MRYLITEPIPTPVVADHDPFAYRVDDGYQSRCKCGWVGTLYEGPLEKARRSANAEGTKHDEEAYT